MGRGRLRPISPSSASVLLLQLLLGCALPEGAQRPGTPQDWRTESQPPLAAEVAAEIGRGLSLLRAVELVATRSPTVEAARRRWLAKIEVEPQVVTPPDPMLQAGYQLTSVETRVGPQNGSIGITQQIPWPQRLWARGRVAAADADIARLRYETAVRDLIIDVKGAYYELFYIDQALPVTERVEEMLRNDAILAYSEMTVGKSQLSEAFRAESQAAQLGYDRILLVEQRAAQEERLRSLLNLPPGTPIGSVRIAPLYEVSTSIEELQARAERYAQVLKVRGLETQRAAYETFLGRLQRIPDVGVGFSYISTGSASPPAGAMAPEDSGKDPFIGLLSMNLPIFEWKNRALIKEREALEEAVGREALADVNEVRSGTAKAWFQVRLTRRLVDLYRDVLLPQAEGVMRGAETYFRIDQASFSNVIETTLAHHNFTLAYLRAIADHGQAIGALERVVGTTAESRDWGISGEEGGADEGAKDE